MKRDLARNLNTDEAAVMGAVYKAADLSTGFKVNKFLVKDAVLYPIQVCLKVPLQNLLPTLRKFKNFRKGSAQNFEIFQASSEVFSNKFYKFYKLETLKDRVNS